MSNSLASSTTITVNEVQVKEILDDINDEFYHSLHETKTELIRKAAKKLEEIDIPKAMIAGRLVKHISFAKERLIYKILGPEYKRDYDKSALNADIDDNNELEEDAKKVAANYDIKEGEQPLTRDEFYRMKERIADLIDKCKYFEDQYHHFKALFEAGIQAGTIKDETIREVIIYGDEYEQVYALMKKSPNGFEIMRNCQDNSVKFKPYKFRRPTMGIEN